MATSATHIRRTLTAAVALVTVASAVVGCSSGSTKRGVPTTTPETALAAAPLTRTPEGIVVPSRDGNALAFDPVSQTLAAVVRGNVVLYSPSGNTLVQRGSIPIAAPVTNRIQAIPGGHFLLGIQGGVVDVDAAKNSATTIHINANILSANVYEGNIFAGTADGKILELQDGKVTKTISGLVRADQILVHGKDAAVIDKAQSSITDVDLTKGKLGSALRVGDGVTNAEIDSYGRVVAVNTTDGQIVGFTAQPLMGRFIYPVPSGPYAVDYDETTKLLWVTVTGTNQVIAYGLATGIPVEKHRYTTVAQPNSIAVNARTGVVYVLSAAGGGVQVITPHP